jgi:hypothetical protein
MRMTAPAAMAAMQAGLTLAPLRFKRGRMMRKVRSAAILMVVVPLAGCATIQKTVDGWFGAATPTPAATAAEAPRVYYAGSEGLKVYNEPSTSSKVVGQLSLHEKVTRTKLERGFAFVESAKSATKGWVNNAQLLWRLPRAPATGAPAAAEPQPQEPAAEAPAAEAPQEPQIPEPTATAGEPLPTKTAAPAVPPNAQGTPRGVAPSIFDAY